MDYARAGGGPEVPFDNAQNWFRHQLAELGIVGCAGWLCGSCSSPALLSGAGRNPNAVPAASLKGALLGLTAASMLGVPSLSPAITLTFWTFAFWYSGCWSAARKRSKTWRLFERRAAGWAFVSAVVVAYAAGTSTSGNTSSAFPGAQRFRLELQLRLPHSRTRSARSDGRHEKA